MKFALSASLLVAIVSAANPSSLSIDEYTVAQTEAALRGIYANTYPANSSYPGVIIASPALDTARPGESGGQNYYYHWTRDAGLTIKTIINQYVSGDDSLESLIKAFIENERKLQRLTTLSGNFTSGGLAEPKYYVNATAFNEPWGRPQRDGPALRATAIMGFLDSQTDASYITNITQTVVKPDLDYVAENWNELGFDLWEEQNNLHFFTAMVQARAMRDGAAFMSAMGDDASAANYLAQEAGLAVLIDSFWNATANTFDAQLNLTKPTGADCANLLASNHASNRTSKYRPSSERILASAATLLDEFTGLYAIDANRTNTSAISVGRYASDVYDGIQSSQGNPWFLCNSAMAETIHLAATEFVEEGSIPITETNLDFFRRVSTSDFTAGTNLTGAEATSLADGMRRYADGFLDLQKYHVGSNFSMAEEYNRTTGAPQGARDLTWSYAAFVTAARARAGQRTYEFTVGDPANVPSGNSTNRFTTNTTTNTATGIANGTTGSDEVGMSSGAMRTSLPVAILLIVAAAALF